MTKKERLARSLSAREKRLWKAYGLTLRQFGSMLAEQEGGCKICRKVPKKGQRPLQVDHDHQTIRVRGLICWNCNHRLLGRGLESPTLHRAAAEYLESTFDGRMI